MAKKISREEIAKAIKNTRAPVRAVTYGFVIEKLYGQKVVSFDPKSSNGKKLLSKLRNAAQNTCAEINKLGIKRARANEVGNDVEKFVLNALNAVGLKGRKPRTRKGITRPQGYPDLCFSDPIDKRRIHYLECKTYNKKNANTTFRSFYFSPSNDPKIATDGHHFCLSFQMEKGVHNGENVFKCKGWRIINLENLQIDLKYEFNSSNRRLYDSSVLIGESTAK